MSPSLIKHVPPYLDSKGQRPLCFCRYWWAKVAFSTFCTAHHFYLYRIWEILHLHFACLLSTILNVQPSCRIFRNHWFLVCNAALICCRSGEGGLWSEYQAHSHSLVLRRQLYFCVGLVFRFVLWRGWVCLAGCWIRVGRGWPIASCSRLSRGGYHYRGRVYWSRGTRWRWVTLDSGWHRLESNSDLFSFDHSEECSLWVLLKLAGWS